MSIVKDSKEDKPTKNVLMQTITKTVGPPSSSTGLVGDQAPETIFSVADFDLIRNQVTLTVDNLQLIKALNELGQITNTQSTSGPIANTQQVTNTNMTDAGFKDIIVPKQGEVWQLSACATSAGYTGMTFAILKIQDTSNSLDVEISSQTSFNTEFALDEPIYIGYPCKLFVQTGGSGTGGSCDVNAALIRVR
jgi:hypothetical protein